VAHRNRSDDVQPTANEPELSHEERLLDAALEFGVIQELRDGRYMFVAQRTRLGRSRQEVIETLQKRPRVVDALEERVGMIRPSWDKQFLPKTNETTRPSQPPHHFLAFAPGQAQPVNPRFVEAGFRVEAFWAAGTGSAGGHFVRGHFHPRDLSSGFEAQHLGNRTELHGLHIRAVNGRPFGIRSLRHRVTTNRELPNKPFSIDGFSNYSVQILLARTFDPRRTVREQFTAFPAGPVIGNDPALPWQTVHVFGFEFVKEVYIASSASVDLDDITLVPYEIPQ